MRYVMLAYRGGRDWDAMPDGRRDEIEQACLAHEDDLRESGHLIVAQGIQDGPAAITVQIMDGRLSLVDGPVAEPQATLVRVFLIDARDLNEAIRVASKMPQTWVGPIEVRPALADGKL